LLAQLRGRWHETRVLDLGVGAGRTAYTIAAIAKEYVGLDYSEPLIELARQRIGESADVRFLHADARDLSVLGDRKFDLIIFSYNGIDYVDEASRIEILRQVREHLEPTNGLFYFSSHSLLDYPFKVDRPHLRISQPLVAAVRLARHQLYKRRLARENRHVTPEEARARGMALLNDGGDFRLITYYVMPWYQARQLTACGFELVTLTNWQGKPVSVDDPGGDAWLHYFCRVRR
jgi:SAM-dependent methyltransferase